MPVIIPKSLILVINRGTIFHWGNEIAKNPYVKKEARLSTKKLRSDGLNGGETLVDKGLSEEVGDNYQRRT